MKRLVAIAFALTAITAWSMPAHAGSNGITVSISPAPIRAAPGEIAQIPLRVSNNDPAHVIQFSVTQRALSLGDDGRIDVLPAPDPAFAALKLPPEEQTLDPGTYRDYTFELTVPPLAPDMYLIGLLLSLRNEQTGEVSVQSQVATFATLDIPGVRDRRLAAELHLPGFRFGSSVSGQVVLANIGGASFNTWGEINKGGSTPERISKTFLAAGHQRSLPVSTGTTFGLGRETVTLSVFHNITDSEVGVDTVSATVWFVHPAYIAEGVAILLAAAMASIEWIRRRRARARRLNDSMILSFDRLKDTDAA